ncbi:predicted protein [Sclerotinia sclerotiorum 1980 UF-70]|uniref:Uncharacterized protein n=2 Tax=Sclerotinia sclerotiorum (strain ATCC 18683 / 1980 / Ss-1) TaxID=665079 RepID=A7E7K9_SCLS1|nr:predicted protein [Sclerotinia sclerotiorum 1980 UF-70]APA06226.1 hypothetical protein sscle_01g009960 [Sclerotinia sclerotiorum 1980 UF-70]EDN96361.1 predicted protein [Sclerotinia sclerotiorum 1980 UF-70]
MSRLNLTWEAWEDAVLLLAIDWYTAAAEFPGRWGPECESPQGPLNGVVIIIKDWVIFLHEGSFLLTSNRLKAGLERGLTVAKVFDLRAIQRRWRVLSSDSKLQSEAAYALENAILPLRTELENRSSTRICYIAGDKLPVGCGEPAAGDRKKYYVGFATCLLTDDIWEREKAAREERERKCDLALCQVMKIMKSSEAVLQQPNNSEGA